MLNLNFTSVAEEIFALTALRKVINPGLNVPELISRDRLPALRILVRGAFSRLVTELIPYLSDSEIDPGEPLAERPYNPKEPLTMNLDFGMAETFMSAGTLLTLKRYLEHLLALYVIAEVYPPDGSPVTESGITPLLISVKNLLADAEIPVNSLKITPVHY